MADLDLTEAVDAAAEAVKSKSLASRSTAPGWVVVTGHATTLARAAVEAAAPLIAAQVRAEALREVERALEQRPFTGSARAVVRELANRG